MGTLEAMGEDALYQYIAQSFFRYVISMHTIIFICTRSTNSIETVCVFGFSFLFIFVQRIFVCVYLLRAGLRRE